jgi:hypothetical protein
MESSFSKMSLEEKPNLYTSCRFCHCQMDINSTRCIDRCKQCNEIIYICALCQTFYVPFECQTCRKNKPRCEKMDDETKILFA